MADPDVTLTPVVVQDAETNRVLMLAYANDEALRLTRETGEAWFWSRSRSELWHKGATSGNTMAVEEISDDCDGDALLYRVRPNGPACHTGAESCFAPWLWRVVAERALERPPGSYVAVSARCRPGGGRPQGRRGGARGRSRGGRGIGRAAGRGARRPLVPQLRPARGSRAPAVRRRGRAPAQARDAHGDRVGTCRRRSSSPAEVVGSDVPPHSALARTGGPSAWATRRTATRQMRSSPQSGRPEAMRSQYAGDVSSESDVLALFDGTEQALGPLDGAVVNAGVSAPPLPLVEMAAERIQRVLDVNLVGALLCAREAGRRLATSRGGRGGSIVLVSSAAARLGVAQRVRRLRRLERRRRHPLHRARPRDGCGRRARQRGPPGHHRDRHPRRRRPAGSRGAARPSGPSRTRRPAGGGRRGDRLALERRCVVHDRRAARRHGRTLTEYPVRRCTASIIGARPFSVRTAEPPLPTSSVEGSGGTVTRTSA